MKVTTVTMCLAGLVLVGCGPTLPVVPSEKQTVELDRRLLTECEQLPDLTEGSDDELNKFLAEIFKNQSECRKKHSGLVQEVKKAFNIK